jgi:hypothetical protein
MRGTCNRANNWQKRYERNIIYLQNIQNRLREDTEELELAKKAVKDAVAPPKKVRKAVTKVIKRNRKANPRRRNRRLRRQRRLAR